jgi:hypothetical protein
MGEMDKEEERKGKERKKRTKKEKERGERPMGKKSDTIFSSDQLPQFGAEIQSFGEVPEMLEYGSKLMKVAAQKDSFSAAIKAPRLRSKERFCKLSTNQLKNKYRTNLVDQTTSCGLAKTCTYITLYLSFSHKSKIDKCWNWPNI